jgi:hypothetical protein
MVHTTMHVSTEKVGRLCGARGLSLQRVLRQAGVSRNAYYSLARKATVLPRSLVSLAACLGVRPSRILAEEADPVLKARRMMARVNRVLRRHPNVDPDNVRHTLILLEEEPLARLRRALLRATKPDIRR